MTASKLTKMQRRILFEMWRDEYGFAAFTGEESRKRGFGIIGAKHGGVIIRAYSNPEYFLKGRGLIEHFERNVPGKWYRMTDKGRAVIAGGVDDRHDG